MDWGSFSLDLSGATGNATKGVGLLTGESHISRGLSMARTLGSEEADQVRHNGRTSEPPLTVLATQHSNNPFPPHYCR